MASFTKRGDGWRAQVALRGVRDGRTFDSKDDAKAWAAEREREIREGAGIVKGKHTVQQMLTQFRDEEVPKRGNVIWETMRIDAWLGTKLDTGYDCKMDFLHTDVRQIERLQSALSAWIADRLDAVMPATVQRELNLLSPIFNHYRRPPYRWMPINPLADLTKPGNSKPRNVLWSDDERDAVLAKLGYVDGQTPHTLKQETAYAFLIALETAMRSGEILALERRHVHLDAKFVHLPKSKNGDERDVPLNDRSSQLLKVLVGMPTRIDAPQRLFAVTDSSRDALFRAARQEAGVKNRHFHDSRANALTYWAKHLDVMTLSKVSGHRDINILNRVYYRITATEIADKMIQAEAAAGPRLRLVRNS